MEKIASFTVNHLTLQRGIYVSRRDKTPSGDVITTFDIRMTEPNRQDAIKPEALHAIEHLAATYLRNDAQWRDRVVYWGPMGCCTGNYLILQGALDSADVVDLLKQSLRAECQERRPATAVIIHSWIWRKHALRLVNISTKCFATYRMNR